MSLSRRSRISRLFLITAIMALFLSGAAFAQSGFGTTDVLAHEWKSITTEHYEVLFPDNLEARARYAASALEAMRPYQEHTLNPKHPKKITLVIDPDTIAPNGYVGYMPFRSVFFTAPITNWPGNWFTSLAMHEGRHMYQKEALDQSTLHIASILFGENAVIYKLWAPDWWFEGDAVMAETVLSEAGRGRSPDFTALSKALILDGKAPSYDQMLLGTYRSQIPGPYEYGYLMYSYMRERYDMQAPATILNTFAKYPIPALGPYLAIKKSTGKSPATIYKEMTAKYGEFWRNQAASMPVTPISALSRQGSSPYRYHSSIAKGPNGSVIAAAADWNKGTEIVSIKDGIEKKLCAGLPLNSLDACESLIVWDESEYGVKFGSDYSRISLYDFASGRKRTLFSHSKYISPAISPDGSTVAMIEFSNDPERKLVLASTADGKIVRSFPLPRGETWTSLSYSATGDAIVFVANGTESETENCGKHIGKIDLRDGKITMIYDAKWENVQTPAIAGETVFYVSNFSGVDAIWAIDSSGNRYEVVSRTIGAYAPKPDASGEKITFVDFANSRGSVVAEASCPRSTWVPLAGVTPIRENFFEKIAEKEPGKGLTAQSAFPVTDAPAEHYSPTLQGNRIDSWLVKPATNGHIGASAGITADNVTGIISQKLNLGFDYTDRAFDGEYEFRYRGFLPDLVFNAGSEIYEWNGQTKIEPKGSAGIEFPLSGGTVGSFMWKAAFGASGGGIVIDGSPYALVTGYANGACWEGRWSLSAWSGVEYMPTRARETIHPYAGASIQSPGILAQDTFSVSGGYEHRIDRDTRTSIGFARGYSSSDALDACTATAQYSVPLLYPDFSVGSLLYVKEIRLNAFYDMRADIRGDERQMSAGGELTFTCLPFQSKSVITTGFRYSRLIREGENAFKFIAEFQL